MSKKFDLIVFDWDGTLFDSTASIVKALQSSCRDLDLTVPTNDQASHVIGLTLTDALRKMAPDITEDRLPLMIGRYKHHYMQLEESVRLFDGAAELIKELHASGFHLAVATGKNRNGLNRAFSNSGLGSYFSATRCADDCFSKPHPQMLKELMEEISVSPDRTLMIGDTTHDMQMAINAGTSSLAVGYGAHPSSQLNSLNPLACVENINELGQWIRLNA